MIEAKDLRIGNYVFTETNTITPIQAGGISAIKAGKLKVKPIPITEEILLKCGFTTSRWDNHSTFRYLFCSSGSIVISLEHKYIEIGDVTLDIEIKHLHHLQNLHQALTGKELQVKL